MAYLAIKKVKGHYYGYMQESYREGGHVRTRTVEYLGAMEPAVAQQVQATRKQLGQADMAALVQSVRNASQAATRAPAPPIEVPPPSATDVHTSEPPQPRYKHMVVNGTKAVVDTRTGAIVSHDVDMDTGQLTPWPDIPVNTTKAAPTLRPFSNALKLPDNIEAHRLSRAAIHGTHRKAGARLKALGINPATMPDVTIRYGHPDSLKQNRDGSYTITASRNPKRRHTVNKTKLWQHYRQALSAATLDAIEGERPELYHQLETRLSRSHTAAKRLLFKAITHTPDSPARWMLSLHLALWDRLPSATTRKAETTDYGMASYATINDWRGEAAVILAEAHKLGWSGMTSKVTQTVSRHKAAITKKRREIDSLSHLDKLAGKRRRLLREIMAAETRLAAVQNLQLRTETLRDIINQ